MSSGFRSAAAPGAALIVALLAGMAVGCEHDDYYDDYYGKCDDDDQAPVPGMREVPEAIDCTGIGEAVFAPGVLHEIHLTLSEENWSAIVDESRAFAEDECLPLTYFEGSIRYDDLPQLDGVGVRIKGNHALAESVELGKSLPLKVDLDRFSDDQMLDGLKKINLHAVVDDPEEWPSDPVSDYLSYTAIREHGVPASRVAFAEVFVNGESQGLYSVVEQIDGRFIRCNFPEPWGDLYKSDSLEWEGDSIADYPSINFKWPVVSDHEAVLAMIRALGGHEPVELEQVLDIDGVLAYFALNIGVGNWDYYTFIPHNYYLYEVEPGRFTMIPWDMNMSQVDWTEPCGVGAGEEDTPMSHRLLRDPEYVARYADILRAFLEGAGSAEAHHQRIDDIEPIVAPLFPAGRLDELRDNASKRVPGMLAALDDLEVCPIEGVEP